MKESELKSIIKEVVRECINEGCGGGHLAGGAKGKRMFKHIKKGYEGEKSAEDAERIAAATVNKNLDEAGKQIPPGKLTQLNPKIAKPASQPMKLPKGNMPFPNPPQPPKQSPLTKEAGLTSEDDMDDMDHGYDESEEIRLIKGLHLITSKLIDMHLGEEEPEMDNSLDMDTSTEDDNDNSSGEEDAEQEPEEDNNEDSPQELNESKKKKIKKKANKKSQKRKMLAKKFKKGLEEVKKITEFFINEASYKVVSPNETDTAKEDKARKMQTEPKVNEASYKVVSPNETDTSKEDKARKIQTEPKVTEAAFKTQARSAMTAKDLPNNPKNVANPKVPMAEEKKSNS